jgi:uncharacterized lipoprotein YmbA
MFALILAGTVLFGCGKSSSSRFYTLFPRQGAAASSRPLKVQVLRPVVPSYLERPELVYRRGPTRLELYPYDRWGAPLEELVSTTLVENLAQRLPESTIFPEQGSVADRSDVVVEVILQRFEATQGEVVELRGLVGVHWRQGEVTRTERHEIETPLGDPGARTMVARMSTVLGKLSDSIAGSIAAGSPAQAMETRIGRGAEFRGQASADRGQVRIDAHWPNLR